MVNIVENMRMLLRISSSTYDQEIEDLINAAKEDLKLCGVLNENVLTSDALVLRAVSIYVKANFGYDNPDSERLMKSYEMLRNHLTLSKDYAFIAITFTITDDSDDSAIRQAYVTVTNVETNFEQTKTTNASGQSIFYLREGDNYIYNITAEDYLEDVDEDDARNLFDVTASAEIEIALTGV
jgi:hypothetical protein